MPDSKVVIAAISGVALLVAMAWAFAWVFAHLILALALVMVSVAAILAVRRHNLRRYGL